MYNVARKLVLTLTQKEILIELAKKNNGVLLTKQANELGISRAIIKELVDIGVLQSVQSGIYVTKDGYADDFFLIGQKYRKGIFSHETALYLLGFSDRAPNKIVMTFNHGTSTSRFKEDDIRPVMISDNLVLGESEIKRNGLAIRVYSIERTLVDLLKPRYDADLEQLIPALKKYAGYSKKDINKLFEYARIFNVEEIMRGYMGVLL